MDKDIKHKEIQTAITTIYPLINLVYIIAACIFLCSLMFKEAILLIICLFFLWLAYELRKLLKIFQLIPKAINSNIKTNGKITITSTNFNECINYYAQVIDNNGLLWKFECLPLDGDIKKGRFEAKLIWIDQINWPILIETENAVIYPKQIPKMNKYKAS